MQEALEKHKIIYSAYGMTEGQCVFAGEYTHGEAGALYDLPFVLECRWEGEQTTAYERV